MRLRIIAPDGTTSDVVINADVIRLGRDPSCEVPFDSQVYPTVAGRHARLEWTDESCILTPLSQSNKTLLNDRAVESPVPVNVGDRIQLSMSGPTVTILSVRRFSSTAPPTPIPALDSGATVQARREDLARLSGEHGVERMPIGAGGVLGRAEGRPEFVLDHPSVSRRHARLTVDGRRILLYDLGSANGTFVNGRRLTKPVPLRAGDSIDIGPFSLGFDGTALVSRSRSNNVELVARSVTRIVKDRGTGKPLTLLDGINLVIRPREFVCLLGPSGSGKTTLLWALSGRSAPDKGSVLLNDKDLYANFEAIKKDIALVPQKDVLHDSLAVEQALWYTAKLRLPPDTSPKEIDTSLGEMLDTVGLTTRRATMIRYLSGGQVKRASLANEILCKPSLLFLDEVTSGLDEQTDRSIMKLFRKLADAGKTVVCVTHSLANVDRTCDLVVILTPGGKLAFVGKPAEALAYFKIERLGDVYDLLEPPKATAEQLKDDLDAQKKVDEQSASQWQKAFLGSPFWQLYVRDRLPPATDDPPTPAFTPKVRMGEQLRLFFRQTVLMTKRYAAIWKGDWPSLLAMAGQAVVVGLLLGLLFGDLGSVKNDSPRFDYSNGSLNLMFLMAISSFWFGCNNAAKEIVKERTIYTRERDFNLRVESYYCSKLLLLTAFSWMQTLLLFVIAQAWCGPPGPMPAQLLVLLMLALTGVTLGLAISAFATSEEMAITLIPMAVLPQIILSGTISPLKGFNELLALIGISTFWGKRGLDATLPADTVTGPVGLDQQHSTSVAFLVLLAHAAVGIGVALTALRWQNRRRH